MKEVEAYRLFANTPGIIHAVDHAVATERGGEPGTKTVYVLLPYFRRGNLQDMINANAVNHSHFPERRLMLLFLGVCRALKSMHQYRARPAVQMERMEMGHGDEDDQGRGPRRATPGGQRVTSARAAVPDDEDEGEQQRPLMEAEGVPAAGERRSYAHRDIKPGNIMISDDGSEPILMDLGSVAVSPLPITNHSLAIQTQDTAAEHSTMPYRAPELFDVQTGTVIDTKVDIWSLGCTLYACLVGKSPFEARSDETGGTLSLCILGGDWRFPDEGLQRAGTGGINKGKSRAVDAGGDGAANGPAGHPRISEPVREVVRRCLRVEPDERPDIDELIEIVEKVIDELPEDDA